MKGRLRRLRALPGAVLGTLFGGKGRWVRPGRTTTAITLGVVLGTALAAGWLWHRATATASPVRTLALAASLRPGPLALDSALEVAWRGSIALAPPVEGGWESLVAPDLPPGRCVATTGAGADVGSDPVEVAVAEVHAAVDRGGDTRALEHRLSTLRDAVAAGGDAPSGRRGFLVRYALARGHAASGDAARAAELLAPALDGWTSGEAVPEAGAEQARQAVEAGRVTPVRALDAVHARHLAGTLAYRRAEPEAAIAWFRRAINGVYYVLAASGAADLDRPVHERRVALEASPALGGCEGGGNAAGFSSLDAYAGLVAAYMADDGFSDPWGLPREVARTPWDLDRDDPFRPVLEHARSVGRTPDRSPIPEHLLWAASNLQRVYHHNRLRPDPRLEVARAVLLLRLTAEPAQVRALEREDPAVPCSTLAALAEDLQGGPGAGASPGAVSPTDSTRAAVALRTFARLAEACPAGAVTPPGPDVRSAWVRRAGGPLASGLGPALESVRADIRGATASNAPVDVLEQRLGEPVGRAASLLERLREGRVPPDMPAGAAPAPMRETAEAWWSAVFADVAGGLAASLRGADGAEPVRAGQVGDLLLALESATAHAGLRPSEVYAAESLAPLVRSSLGDGAARAFQLRSAVRDRPALAAGALAGAWALVALLALLAHVNAWRFRLLTGSRFYRREARARERAAPRVEPAPTR